MINTQKKEEKKAKTSKSSLHVIKRFDLIDLFIYLFLSIFIHVYR